MTIQPDEEELHVIPNAGAPGTAGGGFRVVDRTDATDEEFRARVAKFDAAEEPEEVTVIRAMLDVADNLVYYASKTTGGTHASGLKDAAAQIRAALAGQHTTGEAADRG